jgi:MFS family permease
MWLILALTGSGVAAGVLSALQFLPMLLFSAWGGVLADRIPKRRLITATQLAMAVPALTLFAVTVTGVVAPWMVFALVFLRGTANSIENPARQSFVIEMVGPDRVVNAVSLNSVLIHAARVIGPAIAGTMILLWGVEPCFLLNAATFAAMVFALRGMNPGQLGPPPAAPRRRGAVRDGLRYVARTPALAIPLAMMALVGTLGFNFHTLLPLLARFAFEGGAGAYTALAVAMGAGSVMGALATASRTHVGPGLVTGAALAFGLVALAAAAAPTLHAEIALLVPLGAASVAFAAGVNSMLQLAAAPEMRGRVMGLYTIVFLGSTPIGGPLVGWLSETAGPRSGLVLAGMAALVAAAGAGAAWTRGSGPLAWVLNRFRHHGRRGSDGVQTDGPHGRARDRARGDGDCERVRREGGAERDGAAAERRHRLHGVRHHRHVGGAPDAEGAEAVHGDGHDRVAR